MSARQTPDDDARASDGQPDSGGQSDDGGPAEDSAHLKEPAAEPAEDRETAYGLLQRGQALLRGRHHAAAAIVLERAARLEPGRGSILEALGRAYYNSGQSELARETFEALLETDPSSHYGHYALGQSLKRLERRGEARTHLRLAVALAPNSKLYGGALERLGPPEPNPEPVPEPEPDAAPPEPGPASPEPEPPG